MEHEEVDERYSDSDDEHIYDNTIPGNRNAWYVPTPPTNSESWEENKERLRICHSYLLEQIEANDIIPYLFEKEALTLDDRDEIKHTNPATRLTRNDILIRKILQGKSTGYDILLDALNGNGYPHVADKLTSTPVNYIPGDLNCDQDIVDSSPAQESDTFPNFPETFCNPQEIHVDQMRENRHEQIIQELKADEKLFVETFAFSKAKQVICQSGHVTLTGGPGEGKTLMSRQILLDQIQKGYNPLVVRERRDLDYWNPKEKTAILCDDIFGKSSLHSAADLENAKDIMDKFLAHWNHEKDNNIAIQTTKLHVIITSRNYLLKEARVFRSSHWSIFEGDRVLDLTQKNSLSENEKRKILEIHLRSITYNMQEDDMKSVITITTKSIGFPECCRLFIDTHILGYFKPDPKRFFAEPLEFLVNIIENLYIEKENYKAIFHLLILRNGSIKMQDISTYSVEIRDFLKHVEIKVPNHKDIKEAMDVLCSCFLTSDGCLVMARHPSIFDAIAYVIGCYSPSLVLKCCSLDFIYQRVRIVDGSNPTEPDCEKWFLIQILEDQFKTLAVRFAETVQEKTTDLSLVCSHQACSVQSFVRIFFKQLQARSGKMAKLLKYTKLSTLLKDKDKKCANFIYWSTWNKNGILCKRILRHCSFLETKLVKALYGATISGNTEAFSMLYKKLHPPLAHIVLSSALSEVKCVHTPQQTQDILNSATLKEVRITEPLICIAAKYGKVNILCTMEKEGFPLSVKGKNNMTPLHYACEGGDLVSAHFLITHGASVTAEALDHTLPLSMVRVESMKTQLAEFCDENLLQEVRCMLLKLKDLHVEFVTQETETTTCDFHGILQEVFTHHVYSRKHVAQLMCEDKFPENTLLWLRKQGSSNDSETIMCTAYLLETLSLYVPLYPKLMAHFLSDDVDIPDILSGVFSKSEFLDECIIRLIWSMHIMTKNGDEKLQDSGIKILSKAVTMCDKPWTKAKAIITAGVVVHSYNEQDQFNCLIKGELESIWWLLAWVLEGLKTKSKMVNIGCFQCSWFINVADILKSLNWLSFFDGTRKQLLSMGAMAVIVRVLEVGSLADKLDAVICLQRLAFNERSYEFLVSGLHTNFLYMDMRVVMAKPGRRKDEVQIRCSHLAMLHTLCLHLMAAHSKQTLSPTNRQTLLDLMKFTDPETNVVAAFIYKLFHSDCKKTEFDDVEYFHKDLSSDGAKTLLENKPVGAYILRLSQTNDNQLTLSCNTSTGETRHYLLDNECKHLLLQNPTDDLGQICSRMGISCPPLTMPIVNASSSFHNQNMELLLLQWIVEASREHPQIHTEDIGGIRVNLPLVHLKKLLAMVALLEISRHTILQCGGLQLMISLLETNAKDLSEFSVFHSDDALEMIMSGLTELVRCGTQSYSSMEHFEVGVPLKQLLLALSTFHLDANQRLEILEEGILQMLADILQQDDIESDVVLLCVKTVKYLCTFPDCHRDLTGNTKLLQVVKKYCTSCDDQVRDEAQKTAQLLKEL